MTSEEKGSEAIKPIVKANQMSLIAARVLEKANKFEPKQRFSGGWP
jgi:hypothetical protein